MKVICVVHEEEGILDVAREGDHYVIREWEGGHREEIRRSEHEASRVVQVIMELQCDRRVGERASEGDGPQLVNAGQFGANRN
jgi:hypothetical protein